MEKYFLLALRYSDDLLSVDFFVLQPRLITMLTCFLFRSRHFNLCCKCSPPEQLLTLVWVKSFCDVPFLKFCSFWCFAVSFADVLKFADKPFIHIVVKYGFINITINFKPTWHHQAWWWDGCPETCCRSPLFKINSQYLYLSKDGWSKNIKY